MKKKVFWLLLFSVFCFGQVQEDKAVLINHIQNDMELKPEKAIETALYIKKNFSDKTSQNQADAFLSKAYFLQNKLAESVEIIGTKPNVPAENLLIYTGILYRLGLNPANFFEVKNNDIYNEFVQIEKAFESNQLTTVDVSIKKLLTQTNLTNKSSVKEIWSQIAQQILQSKNQNLSKNLPKIIALYPNDYEFKLLNINYLISKNENNAAENLFSKLPKDSIEHSSNIDLKQNFYTTKTQAFSNSGNASDYVESKKRAEEFTNQINEEEEKTRSLWFSLMEKQNENHTKSIINKGKMWFFGALAFFGFLISIAGLRWYQQESLKKKFNILQEKIKLLSEKKTVQNAIPEKTENLLLDKLEKFEKSTDFLSADISLQSLAKKLDTNTKYLSETINTHKQKNFNGYINELRIEYILLKLKDQPVYRNYKIKYLAEETGFSSHSLFASVFKSVTGMPPMTYIKLLNEN